MLGPGETATIARDSVVAVSMVTVKVLIRATVPGMIAVVMIVSGLRRMCRSERPVSAAVSPNVRSWWS
ncbi:hypothetical protein GCM10023354_17270 [Garicola koreensis]